jgi:hypothetical protein
LSERFRIGSGPSSHKPFHQLRRAVSYSSSMTGATLPSPPSSHAGQPQAVSKLAIGAVALGAFAIGAVAIGALAIGSLAVGRLRLGQGSVHKLHIGELTVDRLLVGGQPVTPPRAADQG